MSDSIIIYHGLLNCLLCITRPDEAEHCGNTCSEILQWSVAGQWGRCLRLGKKLKTKKKKQIHYFKRAASLTTRDVTVK